MVGRKKTEAELAGDREARALAATMGGQVRVARRQCRMTQVTLGRRVGLGHTRISEIERGRGDRTPLDTWVAIGLAVGRPLRVELTRSLDEAAPADAGHLAIQELLIRLGRQAGRTGRFELASRPAHPARSIDVCLRDDRRHALILIEAWNSIGDVGTAVRTTQRKVAEAEAVAATLGGGLPYRVCGCWVVRATASNQRLLARFPHVFDDALHYIRNWSLGLDFRILLLTPWHIIKGRNAY